MWEGLGQEQNGNQERTAVFEVFSLKYSTQGWPGFVFSRKTHEWENSRYSFIAMDLSIGI